MKNLILLVLVVVALFYAQRSCGPVGERTAAERPAGTESTERRSTTDWRAEPNAVVDMQDALGGVGAGPANAARDAVQNQLNR